MNAIFFDFDGTLADTRADLAATVNHTRRDLGLAIKPEKEIISYVGNGARKLLKRAIPEVSGSSDDEARIFEMFMAHYNEHATEKVTLYPGEEATLERLHAAGWLMGINTAKPSSTTRLLVKKFGWEKFFGNAIIAGGDSTEMKPSALPLLDCAAKMPHVVTAADWMVGDNWTDVECAVNAGVGSVYCDFGFGVLRDVTPTRRIGSFPELYEVVMRSAE